VHAVHQDSAPLIAVHGAEGADAVGSMGDSELLPPGAPSIQTEKGMAGGGHNPHPYTPLL
jgi:hypothetical protein